MITNEEGPLRTEIPSLKRTLDQEDAELKQLVVKMRVALTLSEV